MTKERAGRTPWKRALVGPGTVLAAPGRRLDFRTDDGVIIRDAHLDDVLVIPDEVDDWEKEPLALGPGEPDRLPRSPGQMIEQAGRGLTPQSKAVKKAIRGLGLTKVIVYNTGHGTRRCSCGKVILLNDLGGR